MTEILRREAPPAIQSFTAPKAHTIVSGPGAIGRLGEHLERLGVERAFVLTGRSVGQGPLPDALRDAAPGRIAAVFDRMPAHTPLPELVEAVQAARAAGADAVISLGGGAVMDAGKHVVAYLALGLSDAQAIRDHLAGRSRAPLPDMPAQIAIPTTGSAAEFTQFAGVLDPEAGAKRRLDHPQIVPDLIIQDPEAIRHTPPDLWISSSIRTLDHAVEGLYGPRAMPYTDALAEKAIALLARGLPAYRRDPSDLRAIADVQAATWLGARGGTSAGTGISHGIGYLLGAGFGVPHGICSCITLAPVVEWMRPAAIPQLAAIARAMGAADAGTPEGEAAERAAPAIASLVGALGQPSRARDAGVPSREALLALAPKVMRLPHVPDSPRRPRDEDDAEALLATMW